jgi:hypothetical protein
VLYELIHTPPPASATDSKRPEPKNVATPLMRSSLALDSSTAAAAACGAVAQIAQPCSLAGSPDWLVLGRPDWLVDTLLLLSAVWCTCSILSNLAEMTANFL